MFDNISDSTKANIIDSLGGVGAEMAKEFVVNQRRQEAIKQQKQMEMELAETRARAMNNSSLGDTTTDDPPTNSSSTGSVKLGGSGSFNQPSKSGAQRPSVSSELAQAVVDELETMSRAQQQVGYDEVEAFDSLVQQNVSEDQMRSAMEDFDVITPIIARIDV
jgi:hypothetical protein